MEGPTQLKLLVHRMSQPSRTCLLFCKLAGIPFEEVHIKLGKMQQRSAEFLAINPLGKVPALQDGDFCLAESTAILRYLCDTRSVADHWYPREPRARARVCSVLNWHGSTLREGGMILETHRVIGTSLGVQGDERLVASYGLPTLKAALKTIDTVWLAQGSFLAGQAQPSIADLLLSCELEQLCLLDGAVQGPTMAELLAPHPRLQAWLQRLRRQCAPHYDKVHALLRQSRDRLVAHKQQQASKV